MKKKLKKESVKVRIKEKLQNDREDRMRMNKETKNA